MGHCREAALGGCQRPFEPRGRPGYHARMTLRERALHLLLLSDADEKARCTRELDLQAPTGAAAQLAEPSGVPGRPSKPVLVPHTQLRRGALTTTAGHAALLHAVAHIEFNAINLALDAVWRFAGMPDAYYRDWAQVAREEAYHFGLMRDHLASLGHAYGDFPAHDALWRMTERTAGDVLARMALVPRTLEARGLDATPGVRAKLAQAGDMAAAAILDLILREEIGHVDIGNRWYGYLCNQRGLEPIATYDDLAALHKAPALKGPFNIEARRLAVFSEAELARFG
jgi:uncharacterized ferritin-like protein (DUF455 family)